jgi:sugar lactone lactonase YvrE
MSNPWRAMTFVTLAVFAISPRPAVRASPDVIPFTSDRWDLANATIVEHLGRTSLAGAAFLKDLVFDDGVIECDIAIQPGARAYPGVLFRMASDREYERIYLRPHRSPLYADAVQYVATFNGVDSWQLYNGPGRTSAAEIPAGRWLHLRIEVLGTQARIFLDGAPEPVLTVGDLGHGRNRGRLGLTTTADGTAFFSNFSYRRDSTLEFPPPPAIHEAPGIVKAWKVSTPVPRRLLDFDRYPAASVADVTRWTDASTRSDGVLDLSRIHGRLGTEPDAILARTTIHAEEAGPKKYWFGYSDEVSIFLNGQLVFTGNSAYRSRDTSFLGIVGPFDAVALPLRMGDNEVLFAIGEASGGWGLLLQDATAVAAAHGVEPVWATDRDFLIPESVAYDPGTNAFYVSNYDVYHPSRGEPRQFISRVTPDGRVDAREWASGLSNPTGLATRDGRLYAVERTSVAEIDIASARLIRRIPLPAAGFPNDIAIGRDGDLYVSDSRRNAIYRLVDDRAEEWLSGPQIAAPNGVLVHDGALIVGTNGDGCLKSVDLRTKRVVILANLGEGLIDGIEADGGGGLLVSHNEGRILRVTPDGNVEPVLDTTAIRVNVADFAYVPNLRLIVVPTFTDGRLAAYRLDR